HLIDRPGHAGAPRARGGRRDRERRERIPRGSDALRRREGIGLRARGPSLCDGRDDRAPDHGALARPALMGWFPGPSWFNRLIERGEPVADVSQSTDWTTAAGGANARDRHRRPT